MKSRHVFISGEGLVGSVSGLGEMKRQLLFDLRRVPAIQSLLL